MSSSMRMVAMGSRAEQGSSMRITSGCTAMARAMHSRCCWPPDRLKALSLQLVLDLVPQGGPGQALLDQVVHVGLDAVDLGSEGDVVVDRLGERVGLLEHHADAPADLDGAHPGPYRASPSKSMRPSTRAPGIRSFSRLRQRRNVVFPQPDGPIRAVISWRPMSG